ncbi:uncharacterized protein BX664DRAFT_321376 [Halteromyces radiatus]|uniref:uncharacterized protein n=1 Tax=Halteromyces radiatus TaxID=101107 RepID=UPI00221F40BE|nr:uncharacterized protein BX664DRAFT_321376 [Halteromyces radiatus]KAI8099486.1 hypothetical protein BX664DRAFT_321376 [Halteromyces radiatus]
MSPLLFVFFFLSLLLHIMAQDPSSPSMPVATTAFNPNDGNVTSQPEQSWILRDHHYVIIIVIVLVIVGLVLYYIVRSVRGMRKRLARENEQQLQMINQVRQPYSPINETVMMDGYSKYPQQQQQQHQHQHRY